MNPSRRVPWLAVAVVVVVLAGLVASVVAFQAGRRSAETAITEDTGMDPNIPIVESGPAVRWDERGADFADNLYGTTEADCPDLMADLANYKAREADLQLKMARAYEANDPMSAAEFTGEASTLNLQVIQPLQGRTDALGCR